ncbi:uncharacterized protein [Anabrus simplex]|uniref:uncharacterized protein n=1 Tax=Anabrus simplex TaxID=316456 RepID=UPI0034DD4AC3
MLEMRAHDVSSTDNRERVRDDEEEEIVMKVVHPTDENAQDVPKPEELSPLFALFPDLITTFPMPESLQSGQLSTTDVTRELVSLGTKADFSKLKPSGKLIPPRKAWLSALHEVPREVEKMEELEGESSDEDLGKLTYLEEKGFSLESSSSF